MLSYFFKAKTFRKKPFIYFFSNLDKKQKRVFRKQQATRELDKFIFAVIMFCILLCIYFNLVINSSLNSRNAVPKNGN